ncbi:amine sulfotransferase [Ixodes scapularis]
MSISKKGPATTLIDGEVCSIVFDPLHYIQAQEFEPEEGDVIQVSYPRTGTHLVQQMIQLIVNRGQSARTLAEFTQRSPFLEIHGPRETSDAPRLLRTHLPMNRLRLSGKAKYVYVARNPWDCCVSNFHMMQDLPAFRFADGSFEDFLDAFLDGQSGFGDYFNHVISGHGRRQDANVFFVTYEEIVKDRASVVLKLADFLGKGYGEALRSNGRFMELIVERSGVDFMRDVFECTLGSNPFDCANIFSFYVSTDARRTDGRTDGRTDKARP